MRKRRTVLIAFILVPASLALAWAAGIVDFRYRHFIQDEPLKSPIKVVGVDGRQFVLEDGRMMEFETQRPGTVSDILSQSDFQVDLEPFRDDLYLVFARQDGWVCGTVWRQRIHIPIFKDTVYVNRREPIGFAKQANKQPETQHDAPDGAF